MVFGVGQFNYASHIWLGYTLVAMATKICDFQHIYILTARACSVRAFAAMPVAP